MSGPVVTRRHPAGVPVTVRRARGADAACTVLLAEDAGGTVAPDPVGYTMLLAGEPVDPEVARAIRHRPCVELVRFYVHPEHHGSGTAGLLMHHTLAAARATGARGAWLGVSAENARANAFYARHGFEPVGRKRFHLGDTWEDDVVRERALV